MHPKRKKRERTFLDAVLAGDATTVKERLTAGVSVETSDNEHRETALMLAVQFGRDAIVALLLEAGADVSARDATNRTPLMFAQPKYIPMLLAAGAQINAQDEAGETALMKAAGSADIDKVKTLLENGVDRTVTDYGNRNAWDRANDLGISVLIELLAPRNSDGAFSFSIRENHV